MNTHTRTFNTVEAYNVGHTPSAIVTNLHVRFKRKAGRLSGRQTELA